MPIFSRKSVNRDSLDLKSIGLLQDAKRKSQLTNQFNYMEQRISKKLTSIKDDQNEDEYSVSKHDETSFKTSLSDSEIRQGKNNGESSSEEEDYYHMDHNDDRSSDS